MGVLIRLLRETNANPGITSVVVSHDVAEVFSIADYVYIVSDAKVVAQGTPDQVRDSDSEWVQQFINGKADGPAQFHYPGASLEDDLKGGK